MRKFLGGLLVTASLLAASWFLAEQWAADRAREMVAQHPDLQAGAVAPLRRPGRVGLRLDQPGLRLPGGLHLQDMSLHPAALELWLPFRAPLTGIAAPAGEGWLELAGQRLDYRLERAQARVRLSPFAGLALASLRLESGAVVLDDHALLQRLELDAARTGLDLAPAGAGAAYELALRLERFRPQALPSSAHLPALSDLSLRGQGRLWLDRAPSPHQGQAVQVVGLQVGPLQLDLGEGLSALLVGRLVRGANGLTEGRVALYTSDGPGFLDAAIDAGLIDTNARLLAEAMLRRVSTLPMPAPASADGLDFPAPAPGETRIPLILRDGRLFLGDMPLGPAPAFPG